MEAGTVNVVENEPVIELVTVVGDVACVTPSYFIVIVEDAAKPVPDTVTVEPTIPLVGFNVTEAVTVKETEAEWEDTSVAVTV